MRAWLIFPILAFGVGCRSMSCPCSPVTGLSLAPSEGEVTRAGPGSCPAPVCNPAPPAGECAAPQEVHVTVPRQKVIVKRQVPCNAPPAAPPSAPAAPPAASQEVLLVPRTVYVPYAPQVPVAPARMVPLHMAPAITTPLVPLAPSPCPAPCPTPDAGSPAAVQEAARALDELNKEVQQLRQQVKDMKSRAASAADKN